MLPKHLKIHGYRSYVDAEIDFTKFGNIFCVIGDNGAGKSSIIDMITTSLYYRNSCTDDRGSGMDKAINSECDHFELQFCFIMNDVEYLIISQKYREQSRELELYIDGINQSEKVAETQQKINSIIKMDYDTFLDTVCIGQGLSSRFMNKKPNERKETFIQILDLKRYEKYEAEAKERKKEYKDKIDSMKSQIKFIESNNYDINDIKLSIESNTLKVNELQSQINECNKTLNEILKQKIEYENSKKQYEFIKTSRLNLKQKIDMLTKQNDELKNKLSSLIINNDNFDEKINDLRQQSDSYNDEIISIKENISKLTSQKEFINSNINKLNKKYDNLFKYDKMVCDFCGNEISKQHKEEHLQSLLNQINDDKQKIDDINNSINEMKNHGNELFSQYKSIKSQINDLSNEKSQNDKNVMLQKSLNEKIEFQNSTLSDYMNQYQENLKMTLNEIENKTFDDEKYQIKINTLQSELNKINNDIAILFDRKSQCEENDKKIKLLTSQLSIDEKTYSDYNSLSTAFGKSGIQASIISNDLPEIELEINQVLNLLSNGSLSINFITSKETGKNKTKKSVDTLDIIVNDIYGSRSYETYSGGEKFRIDFACHVGLSKFLTRRAGATIDFFVVDEGLGSQDSNAKQKFVESIYQLSHIFKQIMCITHIQELQDSFNSRVLIEKDQIHGSTIKLINQC